MTNAAPVENLREEGERDWIHEARTLGERFARRAGGYDERLEFVATNYDELRAHRFFSAAVPADLGGGGATMQELGGIIREFGRHCGSTALAYSMHSHPVAVNVFKHLRGDEKATGTLRKIAAGELSVAGTGANDWLNSSGEARRVEGGYRVTARKRFVSGGPGANVFVTSARHDGPGGAEVLHFAVPFSAEGIEIVETWRTIGMRGTGSHDVALNDVFVPEEAIVARRPPDVWHPMWDVVIPTAMPLITAAYVGLAEAAAEHAVASAGSRPAELAGAVGEMMNALTNARVVLADMFRINDNHGFRPGVETTNDVLVRKAIAATAVKDAVELAAEIVGGPGFFIGHDMERIVRDVRAMHFHPLPVRRQQVFSGRLALGVDPITGETGA